MGAGSKFKVGDKVRLIADMDGRDTGIGVVAEIDCCDSVDVEFDAPFDGWGDSGRRWNCDVDTIELAPKFSVGDKVRVVKTGYITGGSWHGAKVGEEFTVERIDENVARTASWEFYLHEIEPVAAAASTTYTSCAAAEVDNLADEYGGARKVEFKVGDRVMDIACDENTFGVVNGIYRDGMSITWEDGCVGDSHWPFSNFKLAPLPATLTVQAGRYYKTRDGRKVGPMEYDTLRTVWAKVEGKTRSFRIDNGKHECGIADLDLIAEWQDESVVAPPKFKVGDKVRIARSDKDFKQSHIGNVFTIKNGEYASDGEPAWVGAPDSSPYIWRDSELELVTSPTTIADIVRKHSGTAVVMLIENGQPLPSTRPFVHYDRSGAATEATRLADIHKGQEFGVYECVDVKKVERPVVAYDFEWQTLAKDGKLIPAIKELRRLSGVGLKAAKDSVESWLKYN